VSRELLMAVAREEDHEKALDLWRRLQVGMLSVRQFRQEQAGARRERPPLVQVLAAARRLNRALGRLLEEPVEATEAPRLARLLRRTARLVQRQLAAIPQGGSSQDPGAAAPPARPVSDR
jgi:hypothetical protein